MSIAAAFFAADHKAGATMIAQCAAEKLAERNPSKRIALIHMGPERSDCYARDVSESLERIAPGLSEELLDMEELLQRSRYKKNLYVIGGPVNPGRTGSFHPYMSGFLISRLKSSFDYVIADCGAELENGASLGALMSADVIFTLISQRESCLRRLEWLRPLKEKLGLCRERFVINKYETSSVNRAPDLEKRLKLPAKSLLTIRSSPMAELAEAEGKSLLSYRDPGFSKDIELLCRELENGL